MGEGGRLGLGGLGTYRAVFCIMLPAGLHVFKIECGKGHMPGTDCQSLEECGAWQCPVLRYQEQLVNVLCRCC